MSYMHCSIIRNVTYVYWALVSVTTLSSLVGPGAGFEVARGATGGCKVVMVTTLLFTVISFKHVAEAGEFSFLWLFRQWQHWRFSLWKSPARPAARVCHWDDGVCVSANNVWDFTWDYTYRYLNRHPITAWSRSLLFLPYVFNFKYVFYKYYTNFWVLRV